MALPWVALQPYACRLWPCASQAVTAVHRRPHGAREGFVIVEERGLLRRGEIQVARRSRCGEIEVAAQRAQQDLAREAHGAARPGDSESVGMSCQSQSVGRCPTLRLVRYTAPRYWVLLPRHEGRSVRRLGYY